MRDPSELIEVSTDHDLIYEGRFMLWHGIDVKPTALPQNVEGYSAVQDPFDPVINC